jgi:hypothetical protein
MGFCVCTQLKIGVVIAVTALPKEYHPTEKEIEEVGCPSAEVLEDTTCARLEARLHLAADGFKVTVLCEKDYETNFEDKWKTGEVFLVLEKVWEDAVSEPRTKKQKFLDCKTDVKNDDKNDDKKDVKTETLSNTATNTATAGTILKHAQPTQSDPKGTDKKEKEKEKSKTKTKKKNKRKNFERPVIEFWGRREGTDVCTVSLPEIHQQYSPETQAIMYQKLATLGLKENDYPIQVVMEQTRS